MNKTIFISVLVSCILLSSIASASAGAIAGAAAASAAARQAEQNTLKQNSGGCSPPIEFSQNHSCKLYYQSGYAVASYRCSNDKINYYLQGDCQGGAVITSEIKNYQSEPGDWKWFVAPMALLGLIYIIAHFLPRRSYG